MTIKLSLLLFFFLLFFFDDDAFLLVVRALLFFGPLLLRVLRFVFVSVVVVTCFDFGLVTLVTLVVTLVASSGLIRGLSSASLYLVDRVDTAILLNAEEVLLEELMLFVWSM